MKKRLIVANMILMLIGCKKAESDFLAENVDSIKERVRLEFVGDFIIPVDSIGSSIYHLHSQYFSSGQEYFVGHNERAFTLDLISLTERKVLQSISLNREGPDGIPSRISKMLVHNLDSIFLMQDQKLRIINISGQVIDEFETTVFDEKGKELGFVINYNDANLYYDSPSKAIFVHYFDYGVYDGNVISLEHPILAKYYLKERKFEFLPIHFSDFIRSNRGNVGQRMPNFSYVGNRLIYGFPVESNIFVYDFDSGRSHTHGGQSRYCSNIEQKSNDPNYNFRADATWFHQVQLDEQTGLFFRTHWGTQLKKLNDSTYSTAYTRPGYLMFFNESFEVVDEIVFDPKYWVEESFSNSLGMFFAKKDLYIDNDSILVFGQFRAIRQ